ncbi:hypothetical protein ASD8599_02054 [Ascidiaceihabitans donghaensis]|uniref:Uncharacterized protein n=1 Tax=Ascidiaceihabitans donghaensis TaxID=1510460 RepID=A0A2R8BE61_9RHOB|nr:hypothetical protein ASD8599_02054 [Ascidiaceihabitans donghaensis]
MLRLKGTSFWVAVGGRSLQVRSHELTNPRSGDPKNPPS